MRNRKIKHWKLSKERERERGGGNANFNVKQRDSINLFRRRYDYRERIPAIKFPIDSRGGRKGYDFVTARWNFYGVLVAFGGETSLRKLRVAVERQGDTTPRCIFKLTRVFSYRRGELDDENIWRLNLLSDERGWQLQEDRNVEWMFDFGEKDWYII